MDYYQAKSAKELEIFEQFKRQVLQIKPRTKRNFQNAFTRRSFFLLSFVSMAMFLISLGFFLFCLLSFEFNKPIVILAIGSLSLLGVLSIAIFICYFVGRTMRTIWMRVLSNVLYYAIIFVATLLIIMDNIISTHDPSITGSTISTIASFYFVLFAFLPLAHTGDMGVLLFFVMATAFIPDFAKGNDIYNLTLSVILRLFVIGAYISHYFIQKNLFNRTEQIRELNDNLIFTAYKDQLTSALNRLALDTYWKYIQDNNEISSVGVVLFDIDNFKSFNDTYSHLLGDKVLQTVCKVVTDAVNEENLYFFRYGGEEFIVIIENPTDEEIIALGEKIRNTVYDANFERNDDASYNRITVTVGCSFLKKIEMIHGDFVSKADKALYQGKSGSKNCVVYKGKIY